MNQLALVCSLFAVWILQPMHPASLAFPTECEGCWVYDGVDLANPCAQSVSFDWSAFLEADGTCTTSTPCSPSSDCTISGILRVTNTSTGDIIVRELYGPDIDILVKAGETIKLEIGGTRGCGEEFRVEVHCSESSPTYYSVACFQCRELL